MAGGSTRVVLIAFIMNVTIAVSKFIAWFFTGSASMLAESFHSVADSLNQIFLFVGIKSSQKPPDAKHPFGYGSEEYFWSFLVALLIFLVGAIFAIYEGVEKLLHPTEITNGLWNIGILGFAVLLETYSAFVATKEFNRVRGPVPFFKFMRGNRNQILITVLFEDYAALMGLVLAFAGNLLAWLTGNPLFDAVGSIAIGLLLGIIAGFLYFEAKSLLIGEAASPEDLAKIQKVFDDHPDVVRANEILTLHFGAEQMLINAHIKFRPGMTIEEGEKVIDEIEARIAKEIPAVYKIFIETHQKDKVGSIRDLAGKV